MNIILSKQEYNFLISECELLKKYFNSKNETTLFSVSNKVNIKFGEDLFLAVLNWVEENLDRHGYDIDYNLNEKGVLLENILDKLVEAG